jgi:hypothetical protein
MGFRHIDAMAEVLSPSALVRSIPEGSPAEGLSGHGNSPAPLSFLCPCLAQSLHRFSHLLGAFLQRLAGFARLICRFLELLCSALAAAASTRATARMNA